MSREGHSELFSYLHPRQPLNLINKKLVVGPNPKLLIYYILNTKRVN